MPTSPRRGEVQAIALDQSGCDGPSTKPTSALTAPPCDRNFVGFENDVEVVAGLGELELRYLVAPTERREPRGLRTWPHRCS